MDIRQYDLYIDGHKLPRWFLTDADTQLGMRPEFMFSGYAERADAAWVPGPDDVFAPIPTVSPFAELSGHRLAFKLVPSGDGHGDGDTHFVAVKLTSGGSLHAKVEDEGDEEVVEYRKLWWELESREKFVVYVDYHGARKQMTLEARRCRIPLRDRSRELLDRLNRV